MQKETEKDKAVKHNQARDNF